MRHKNCQCDWCRIDAPEIEEIVKLLSDKQKIYLGKLVGRLFNAEDDAIFFKEKYFNLLQKTVDKL